MQKSSETGRLLLTLSGRIESELLAELGKIFESHHGDREVVLDLEEVKLVDSEVVPFLAKCEGDGI